MVTKRRIPYEYDIERRKEAFRRRYLTGFGGLVMDAAQGEIEPLIIYLDQRNLYPQLKENCLLGSFADGKSAEFRAGGGGRQGMLLAISNWRPHSSSPLRLTKTINAGVRRTAVDALQKGGRTN